MEFGKRINKIIPIDENTEDELIKIFDEYSIYTSNLLKDNYNYVWFEISDHSKLKSITFTRRYTNYYNEREKVIIEKQFESEKNHLKQWIHRLYVQIKYNNVKDNSIRINIYGNGFSFQAGIEEEFSNEEKLDNLINYLKKNPEKMYFVRNEFRYIDKEENLRIVDGEKLKEIMFRLMNIKEK